MQTKTTFILNNLRLQHTPAADYPINLSLSQQRYGLVGRNGIGKTTLMRLMARVTEPSDGSIKSVGACLYHPQLSEFAADATIADMLGVMPLIEALERIQTGDTDPTLYERLEGHWDIQDRCKQALHKVMLTDVTIDTLFSSLSGGQQTKVYLARLFIFDVDFMLLDEPTNNLDSDARALLLDYIQSTSTGMLIISHDRTLLNHCDQILELNEHGIEVFGGNYDFYREQKSIHQAALDETLHQQMITLEKAKKTTQQRLEKHQQSHSKGKHEKHRQIRATGSYNKIELKSKQGQSENTNKRIRTQAQRQLSTLNERLTDIKSKSIAQHDLNIQLNHTAVAASKRVLAIDGLTFAYPGKSPLFNHLSFDMVGPQRLALIGPNGCGKSTLLKLIKRELTASCGNITVGVDKVVILDQQVSFIDPTLSLVDNFQLLNPGTNRHDAYTALAWFNFRNTQAEKLAGHLSGGERMRAGLAMSLMSPTPPQLIMLDEPTNHLDIPSIEAIEAALSLYQGAMLVVSHDVYFLERIKTERLIL